MNSRIIQKMDYDAIFSSSEIAQTTSLLDALHLAAAAWERVTETTSRNCFRKGGFVLDFITSEENNDDIAISTPCNLSEQEFLDWIDIDQYLPTTHEVTDEDILSKIAEHIVDENAEVEEEADDDNIEERIPTNQERLGALEVLKRGVHHYASNFKVHYNYERFISNLINENKKQTKILDFFEKV